MKETQILMSKHVYLGISILELSKTLMYEFWHEYVKPKYDKEAKQCDIDTGSFIVYKKADDIYKDIAEDGEVRLGTSNYELNRPLTKIENKKVVGLMKEESGGKIMTKFVGLRVIFIVT